MQTTAPLTTISCSSSSRGSLFFNPILKFIISTPNPIISPHSPIQSSLPVPANSYGLQERISVVYARKKRRRTEFQRSAKLMLQLASLVASNLKILPPPLDFVIEEFSGGDGTGNGGGLWKGFGGDGFHGGRRKGTNPSLFIAFLIICGIALLLFTELEIDSVCGILGFVLFSVALIQLWRKRGVSGDFIWGFSLFGILVALGLRRFEIQKWMRKIKIRSPNTKIWRRKICSKKVF